MLSAVATPCDGHFPHYRRTSPALASKVGGPSIGSTGQTASPVVQCSHQPSETYLGVAELPLDHAKRGSTFARTCALAFSILRLALTGRCVYRASCRCCGVLRPASHFSVGMLGALFDAGVAGIGETTFSSPCSSLSTWVTSATVLPCPPRCVPAPIHHQRRCAPHAKVILVPLLGLVHFRVALASWFLDELGAWISVASTIVHLIISGRSTLGYGTKSSSTMRSTGCRYPVVRWLVAPRRAMWCFDAGDDEIPKLSTLAIKGRASACRYQPKQRAQLPARTRAAHRVVADGDGSLSVDASAIVANTSILGMLRAAGDSHGSAPALSRSRHRQNRETAPTERQRCVLEQR